MKTTAEKTEDGKHWVVNGTKKWITNGTYADYFTVGCRTRVSTLALVILPMWLTAPSVGSIRGPPCGTR